MVVHAFLVFLFIITQRNQVEVRLKNTPTTFKQTDVLMKFKSAICGSDFSIIWLFVDNIAKITTTLNILSMALCYECMKNSKYDVWLLHFKKFWNYKNIIIFKTHLCRITMKIWQASWHCYLLFLVNWQEDDANYGPCLLYFFRNMTGFLQSI